MMFAEKEELFYEAAEKEHLAIVNAELEAKMEELKEHKHQLDKAISAKSKTLYCKSNSWRT